MGAFVYQRKETVRDGADACERRCKRFACDLQVCVSKLPVEASTQKMDMARCEHHLAQYNRCCDAVKAEAAEPARAHP